MNIKTFPTLEAAQSVAAQLTAGEDSDWTYTAVVTPNNYNVIEVYDDLGEWVDYWPA